MMALSSTTRIFFWVRGNWALSTAGATDKKGFRMVGDAEGCGQVFILNFLIEDSRKLVGGNDVLPRENPDFSPGSPCVEPTVLLAWQWPKKPFKLRHGQPPFSTRGS